MGTLKIVIPDELEERLRKHIATHKGLKKGVISESVNEAIQYWLQTPNRPQNSDKFREQYPGKYLAVMNSEILIITDTLEQLFEKVALISEKVYIVHPKVKKKKVRLGWKSQAKS